jgi:hypothetical protein
VFEVGSADAEFAVGETDAAGCAAFGAPVVEGAAGYVEFGAERGDGEVAAWRSHAEWVLSAARWLASGLGMGVLLSKDSKFRNNGLTCDDAVGILSTGSKESK